MAGNKHLTSQLEEKGSNLVLTSQKISKRRKKLDTVTIIVLSIITIFYSLLTFEFIKFDNEIIYHWTIVSLAIYLVINTGMRIKIKRIKNEITPIDSAFLYSYNAFISLELHLDRGQSKHKLENLDDAIKNISKLSYIVSIGWRKFTKDNNILSNLDTNMNTFVESLNGLKKTLKKEPHKPNEIKTALIQIMEFLMSNKKNNFKKINKELEEYNFKNQTITIRQQIKEFIIVKKHIIVINILSAAIITPIIVIMGIDSSLIEYSLAVSAILAPILGAQISPWLKKIATSK